MLTAFISDKQFFRRTGGRTDRGNNNLPEPPSESAGIKTKALNQLIASLYEDILEIKGNKKRRKKIEKGGTFDFIFLQERENKLSKSCHKKYARICGTHHLIFFSSTMYIVYINY